MARIFITGSADGLGRMAAELLIEQGHRVVLHARSQARADETKRNVPEAEAVVIGDLGTIAQTRKVAEQVNALGAFDAVIHNAAVGYKEPKRIETEDGLSHVLRGQHHCSLHPDSPDREAEATRLSQLHASPERRSDP